LPDVKTRNCWKCQSRMTKLCCGENRIGARLWNGYWPLPVTTWNSVAW
jgi:hypothetical protein